MYTTLTHISLVTRTILTYRGKRYQKRRYGTVPIILISAIYRNIFDYRPITTVRVAYSGCVKWQMIGIKNSVNGWSAYLLLVILDDTVIGPPTTDTSARWELQRLVWDVRMETMLFLSISVVPGSVHRLHKSPLDRVITRSAVAERPRDASCYWIFR